MLKNLRKATMLAGVAAMVGAGSGEAAAQTVLNTGDVAVVGYQADDPDRVRLVSFVDLEAGTVINLTDAGIRNDGYFRWGEGRDSFVLSEPIARGETFDFPISGVSLNANGDQVFVYQGVIEQIDNPAPDDSVFGEVRPDTVGELHGRIIWGFDANAGWVSVTNPDTVESALPGGLASSAMAPNPERDNLNYTGPRSGSPAQLRAWLTSNANWLGTNSAPDSGAKDAFVMDTRDFEILDCTTNFECNDGNACTNDFCRVETGECVTTTMAGCCNADTQCNDGDVCTADVCSGLGGTCSASEISDCCEADEECDDGAACTTDACDLTTNTCTTTPVEDCCTGDEQCDDSDACTADTCDVDTGECLNADIDDCCTTDGDCDDGNTCTTDSCSGEGGACTNDAIEDCCTSDGDCDDGNTCTQNVCNTDLTRCEEPVLVPGCCVVDGDCTDGDECTMDTCVDNACTFVGMCDAGPPDAMLPPDAGTPDAMAEEPDAMVEEPDAMVEEPDAAAPPADGGLQDVDAATVIPPDDDDEGCGCAVTSGDTGSQTGALLLMLFVGVTVVRRRRD